MKTTRLIQIAAAVCLLGNDMKRAFLIIKLLALPGILMPAVAQEVSIPDPGLNAAIRDTLGKPSGPLTAQDLLSLTNLDVSCTKGPSCWGVRNLEGLGAAHNLTSLYIGGNDLTNLVVPAGLTSLTTLGLDRNPLTDFSFLASLTSLTTLYLGNNGLTELTLPAGLTNLTTLHLYGNRLTDFSFLSGLTSLTTLNLSDSQLTTLTLPAGLTNLTTLYLIWNRLTDFSFLNGLTSLTTLNLNNNGLTTLTLPVGLTNLAELDLSYNQLTRLSLPAGLTSLTALSLHNNQLTNVTLPVGLANLSDLSLEGNPLSTLVLPASAPTSYLAVLAETFRNGGVSIYTYPLAVSLINGRQTTAGAFEFTLTGPPGAYAVLSSTDLRIWNDLGTLSNQFGTFIFTDLQTILSPQKFYHARSEP